MNGVERLDRQVELEGVSLQTRGDTGRDGEAERF